MGRQPQPVHQLTATQFEGMFPDEAARKAYLVGRRWPEGVHCPRCGNREVYAVKARTWIWQCERCAPNGYRFPITTGTIFEKTNRPLRDWYRVTRHKVRMALGGYSASRIARKISRTRQK